MDTSKEYILMCKLSDEIQELKYKYPQAYYFIETKPNDYMVDNSSENEPCNPCKTRLNACMQFHSYGGWSRKGWIYIFLGNYPPLKAIKKEIWDTFVYLPRQDELQALCRFCYSPWDLINMFQRYLSGGLGWWFGFSESNYPKPSMEQLWLAFVMKKIFGKVWNGKTWKF